MRRARIAPVVIASLALALLPVPAFASAAENTYVSRAGAVTYTRVHASRGYRLNFSQNARGFFEAKVIGHHGSVRYDLHGAPAGSGVTANLGGRGEFDLRFVPLGRSQSIPHAPWCEGRVGHFQPGYLVGAARFRGEGGFTEARIHRVPAARETWPSRRCHYLNPAAFGHPRKRRAAVRVWGDNRGGSFSAVLFHRDAKPRGRRVVFRAVLDEKAGRLSIGREAKVEAAEGTFSLIGGKALPEEAEVTPPAPFTGSASFTRTPESTFSWSGDLAVRLPGRKAPLALTGPSYSSQVCALEGCVHQGSEGVSGPFAFERTGPW